MRPLLLPHLRRLWRDGHTVQLGTDPKVAILVELANPAAARVLDLLDGARTEHQVLTEALHLGVPTADARALIEAMREAGLVIGAHTLLPEGLAPSVHDRLSREAGALALSRLAGTADVAGRARVIGGKSTRPNAAKRSPAQVLRRRALAQVLVAGHAWLGVPIAAALATAGIGHIDPAIDGWTGPLDAVIGGLLPADVNRSRASAAADAVRRAAPEAHVAPLRAGTATFVVRVGTRPGSALATRGVRLRAAPRLDVYLRDGTVIVGPLVTPTSSPCGQCLELHRRDRDAAWPALAAQLATGRETIEACAVTTALAGAAYAAGEVLSFIDGGPVHTAGAVVEVTGAGHTRRRTWPPHPRCDCSRGRRSSTRGGYLDRPSNNGS